MATMINLPDGSTIDYDNESVYLTNMIKTGTKGKAIWAEEQMSYYDSLLGKQNIENNPAVQDVQPETPAYPEIPQIDPYDSSYKDVITDSLSDIMNYDDFQYDPARDPSYQAYIGQMTTLGNKAFTNNLATMSSATGGMPNSWAQTVATQQQGQFLSEASANMAQFEGLAYQKYLDKYNMTLDKFGILMDLDDTEYNRYLDSVNMKYQEYEYEVQSYHAQLDEIQTQIDRAWDRTNTNGYVNNEDSAILGIAPGTPSQEIMLMKEEMDYYLQKLAAEMEATEAQAEKDFARELELVEARADIEFDLRQRSMALEALYAPSSSGGSSGSGGYSDGGVKEADYLTSAEMNYIREQFGDEISLIDSPNASGGYKGGEQSMWTQMSRVDKISFINEKMDRVYDEFYMSDRSVKSQFKMQFKFDMLERKPSYQNIYVPYVKQQEELQLRIEANNNKPLPFKMIDYMSTEYLNN